ncbi:hypothetical protein NB311A_06306 [Nitrobacter sp. Nb-311A]|nr:hypothetical protein NB311A_06306 [Nitrobacter sp. Nb-311A]
MPGSDGGINPLVAASNGSCRPPDAGLCRPADRSSAMSGLIGCTSSFPESPMRASIIVSIAAASAFIGASRPGPAWGQTPNPVAQSPGVITSGSQNVTVNGKPAARQGDATTGGALIEGSSNVFINGKPATVTGDRTGCGGSVASGGHGVFINGKPMARQGDQTSGCAK